jgi:hypothetical protein
VVGEVADRAEGDHVGVLGLPEAGLKEQATLQT